MFETIALFFAIGALFLLVLVIVVYKTGIVHVNGRDKLSQKWSFKIEPPIVVENA